MSPLFRGAPADRPASETPESLLDDLPKTRDGVGSLWAHQADLLRLYHESHLASADVALELPTGAGKTLPALLIAEWRRSSLEQRVAYACPTVQLANQVLAAAVRQGIDAVSLLGSHHRWEVADAARYDGGRSIAITTYSTIFNSKPAISQPDTLLFDDAHAGEQYVADSWSVPIDRYTQPALYNQLLAAIGSELSGTRIQQLQAAEPDPNTRGDVRLLPAASLRRKAEALDLILGATKGTDTWFRYSMVRQSLDRCLLYFGWSGFLIRPYIAPTFQHPHFVDAVQRVYISATLGDGGELERAFGRAPIDRLPVPGGWAQRSAGRRFFVFPELMRGVDPQSMTRSLIRVAAKALVIAPGDHQLQRGLPRLLPDGFPTFGKGDIESSLEGFSRASTGVLALANRYDGMDLADDSCRMTVLDGLPGGEHLQERFLIQALHARRVLEERLRTRILQGAGRSTRGLTDHSVVVVLGVELTRFLQRREVRSALRAETQAEIGFGINNSEVSEADLRAAVVSCLRQDDDWQQQAEPLIAELRRDAIQEAPPGTDALAASVRDEVKAWNLVWAGDYLRASATALDVARSLTSGALDSYRSFWLYLAAVWQEAAADEADDGALRSGARELFRKAHAASRGSTWIRNVAPLPIEDALLEPEDENAVSRLVGLSARRLPAAKFAALCVGMIESLTATEAGPYEQALTTLGTLVGAEAFKPAGQGRADSVWLFGTTWWVTIEAKSESASTGLLSMDYVRQVNTQMRSLVADRETDAPVGSVSVVVTPKQLVDPDAVSVADAHVCLCAPGDILGVAHDVAAAWREFRAEATDLEGAEAAVVARRIFSEHHVLPTSLRERLADRPVNV